MAGVALNLRVILNPVYLTFISLSPVSGGAYAFAAVGHQGASLLKPVFLSVCPFFFTACRCFCHSGPELIHSFVPSVVHQNFPHKENSHNADGFDSELEAPLTGWMPFAPASSLPPARCFVTVVMSTGSQSEWNPRNLFFFSFEVT